MTVTHKRQGNREKLLRAAIVCLRDKGYSATTARDLAAVSGANLASIGYHFGGVESLMNEAVAETTRAWARSIQEETFAGSDGEPREQVRRTFAASVDRFDELEPYLRSFIQALPAATREQALRAGMASAYEDVRRAGSALIERIAEGEPGLGPEHLRTLSSLLLAVGDGLIVQWLLDPEAVPSSDAILAALERAAALLTGEVRDA